jgi:hypothetical protein
MATLPMIIPCNDISVNNFQLVSEFSIYTQGRISIYKVSYNQLLHLIHISIIPDISAINYTIQDYYVSHSNIYTNSITLRHVLLSLNIDMRALQFNNFICNDAPDTHPSNYIDTPISSCFYANFDLISNNIN